MDLTGFLWTVIKFVGPVLLLAALGWAIWRNRQSRVPKQVTERATERVYQQEERAEGGEADKAP